jgi:transposase
LSRLPGKRARPVLRGLRRGDAPELPDWRIWYYLLEAAGLAVDLVNARDVKNVPGRPKTDKLDAVWLAKLTEKGLLRPSFVPPAPIRELRDYTRLREDLTRERTRYWQRLEKLLEDALIKLSSVTSTLTLVSVRDMLEALIAGERDPQRLAELARGRLKAKHDALVAALDGRFDDHHGELTRLLLDQIDALNSRIEQLTARIEALITAIDVPHTTGGEPSGPPSTPNPPADSATPHGIDTLAEWLSTVERLNEITGIGARGAQVILAEIGWDMSRFPTPQHLVSWAKLCPRTIQSGPVIRGGRTGKGNPYLKGVLGEAAAAAARSDTFLGERHRRIVKRRGKLKALVAVARSILVIIWHLLTDPNARFHDLGPDYYTTRIATQRKLRSHINQLAALGYRVTLEPAA